MLSVLKAFNMENVVTCLKKAYRIVTKKAIPEDFRLMVPQVCCSHIMKNFHTAIKKTNIPMQLQSFLLYVSSLLVNAYSLEVITDTYGKMYVLLNSERNGEDVERAYSSLVEKTKSLGSEEKQQITEIEEMNEIADEENDEEDITNSSEELKKKNNNPFAQHFHMKRTEIDTQREDTPRMTTRNACYNTQLLEYINKWRHVPSGVPCC